MNERAEKFRQQLQKELGLTVLAGQRAPILEAVKKRAIAKRGLLSDEEFRQIVADSLVVTG